MKKNLKNKKAFSLIELSIVILIVGIVVAGVTQASRLVSAFKLSAARNITQSSPVNSIKDLAFWLESTSEKSFDAADQDDGLSVDNWYDINPQVTTKINFTQSTSGRYPLYKASAINSIPAVSFDGANDYLGFSAAAGYKIADISQGDQITIFLVERMFDADASIPIIMETSGNYDIHAGIIFPFNSTQSVWDFGTCCIANQGRITGSFSTTDHVNKSIVLTILQKSATATVRVNGSVLYSAAMSSTFSNADLSSNMVGSIGAYYYSPSVDLSWVNGYIGEVIVFRRALKADEITDVERYLGKKWGISVS